MYDLNKRSYISTLGELRALLADLPDSTEISGAGAAGAWLHVAEDEHIVCIDPNPLYDCYEEYDDNTVETAEDKQRKAHEARLMSTDDEPKYYIIGNKLLRIHETIDDCIDEDDEEPFGACWDYKLYDVQLKVVDEGQIGKCGNMTRKEAIDTVLTWNNLKQKERHAIIPTESLTGLCECS